uniref:Uncharacterized protein n=1 Tax=Lactuca sativa TaxID=4236 RepID=A0A9R1WWN6_LACSA|nr:hypothetical protein LSAT_V11C800402970 [Lactuca sativa]
MENNIYCCYWFLMRLRESLRQEHVFPSSYNEYTFKSVFKYMRTRGVYGRTLQSFFWMTSNSYIVSDFEEKFCRLTPDAREVLANIGHAKWARTYFSNIRWNVVNIDIP